MVRSDHIGKVIDDPFKRAATGKLDDLFISFFFADLCLSKFNFISSPHLVKQDFQLADIQRPLAYIQS